MNPAILSDLTKCIGCRACVLACQQINELPINPEVDHLSASTLLAIEEHGNVFVRRSCLHCLEPTCVSVCPVGALQKSAEGPVIYDESRCMGCRYCMLACPFGVPTYEWHKPLPAVRKCMMCYEKRLSQGEQPACTSVCPTGAIVFGDRDELIATARRRIDEAPERYVDHIYGLEEAGGTSLLFLSSVPFEELGFRTVQAGSPYPRLTWNILEKIPTVVLVGGTLLTGLWWLTHRRDLLEQVRHGEITLEEAMGKMPPLTGGKSNGQKSDGDKLDGDAGKEK